MNKIKLLIFLNNFQSKEIINSKIIIQKIKNTNNYLLKKYENLNDYKIFKYGKYTLLIPIIYYVPKKLLIYKWGKIKEDYLTFPNETIKIPFTNIEIHNSPRNVELNYPVKNYKIKEIGKYEIGEEILKILNENLLLKNEFLLNNPEIIINEELGNSGVFQGANNVKIYFKIKTNNFSNELKELLIKNPMFIYEKNTEIENKVNKIYGVYIIDNKKKPIYEVAVENRFNRIYQTKEFENYLPSRFRCPITATENALINYYLQIKENKNINLIESLFNNLNLFSKFLDEFPANNNEIKNKEIKYLLGDLITTYDFTEVFSLDGEILKEKLLTSFKNKNLQLVNKKNITDNHINEKIQLVSDKLTNIFHTYNPNQVNILKHINTIFILIYIWQMFNYYLYEKELPLLPALKVNAPYITPRFWGTLNAFNSTLNLKWLGGHFDFSYFTLNKKEAEDRKKSIEE